jgi:MFS family permease
MNIALSFPTQRYYRIAVSAFFFIMGFTFATWASRIPDIKTALHLSDAGLGTVLLGIPVGQMVAMFLSGYLVTKFGSKRTMIVSALLYPGCLLILGSVTQIWQLMTGLFLFGVFANLFNISVNTQAVGVERLYRRSIMASFHGLWSLAGFTGGLLSTLMVAENISPFTHFCIAFLVTMVLLITARRTVLPRDTHQKQDEKTPLFVKPDRYIIKLGLIAFASMICEGTMFDWSGVYFQKIVEAPQEFTRLGYVAFMSTMAGGRLAADWFVTRYGVRRILGISGLFIVSGMLLAVGFPQLVPATLGFLLVGIGVSSVVPLIYSLAGKSETMSPGVALASVSSIGFTGFLIGPPLIGYIAQAASLRWSFTLMAVLGLGTSIVSRKLKD